MTGPWVAYASVFPLAAYIGAAVAAGATIRLVIGPVEVIVRKARTRRRQ